MIKKKAGIIFALVMLFALSGCSGKTVETAPGLEGDLCEIYYYDQVTQNISHESAALEGDTQTDIIRNAFARMQNIAKTEERRSVVPENLKINSVQINNGTLDVDFNSVYNTMPMGDKLIFRTAALYTFTSLDFVDYVRITVDGNLLKMTNGQTIGKIGRDDVVMDGNISAAPTNYEIITLYFKSSDGTKLAAEIREVEVNPNQPIERYVVEQLIKGPESTDLKAVVPLETKIRDISVADGVCYVDLSSEFVTKQVGSEKEALAGVYSIVNSLCEMETVNKVQFLVEGEKLDNYKNIIDLGKTIEPNYDITFD